MASPECAGLPRPGGLNGNCLVRGRGSRMRVTEPNGESPAARPQNELVAGADLRLDGFPRVWAYPPPITRASACAFTKTGATSRNRTELSKAWKASGRTLRLGRKNEKGQRV